MKFNKITRIFVFILCFVPAIFSQTPTPTATPNVVGEVTVTASKANIDPVYQEFRKGSDETNAFSGEYAIVNNLIIKRDAGIFTLKSGEIYFLKPMAGKRTGAVFFGEGEFSLVPPVDSEKKMLEFFIQATEVKEKFSRLVMFFTDQTFDEIKGSPMVKMSTNGSQSGRARDEYREKEDLLKNSFHYNMATRILMDAYAPPRPGFFTSFIQGEKNGKLVYQLDPLGIADVSPEQVMLYNYSDNAVWTAFHLEDEYKKGTANNNVDRRIFDLSKHEIDITLRGTKIFASDKVTIKNLVTGQRVLPFDLFPSLRVKRVFDANGQEINIIQEDKNKDGSLAVILPSAPAAGQSFVLNFEYEGDNAVINRGSGNFTLVPRSTWYPNNGGTQFGDRAAFDITFRYPKQLVMVGVGDLVEPEKLEGDQKIAKWSTKGVEMAVAGFNYGDFVVKEVKDESTGLSMQVYANREATDDIKSAQNFIAQREAQGSKFDVSLNAFSTTEMSNYMLGETQNATRIYDAYFGKLPFNRIAMTQQPAANFGQAWPTLVYMPFLAFVGSSMRTQLIGMRGGTDGFWTEVGPHEIAHQWWGHSVGWTSYHDQWMSEGFAQLSTSLYIQFVKKDLKAFTEFWEDQRKQITESSPQTKGLKPYTVGPVTQGYRLNTSKTGRIAQNLIYPKGAYILHMIRMMMNDRKDGDNKFQLMMRDFIKTHFNQDISTEDFKAIVEKHMTPKMDVDKNGKMDWFFDEWVYGKEVPAYKLEYSINNTGGKSILSGKITQSGVSDNFAMIVPLYLDFGNGWVSAGSVTIVGNKSFDLGNIELPREPKKVAICALNDILATRIDNEKK
jgi:hypothetical protein